MSVDGSLHRAATANESDEVLSPWRRGWIRFRDRVIQGLFLILPLLITCWVLWWLFLFVKSNVVAPLTAFVNWKVKGYFPDAPLPYWFEQWASPIVGILALIIVLYLITFLAYTPLHRAMTWLLVHLPIFSWVYNPVRRVFSNLETQTGKEHGHKRPQRMVLITFPHTGMKVPAIVTATTRDRATGKVILCAYVPTTPVPTSGYFLLVPEEQTTELNWSTEQTLQSIISGGLAAPPEVTYFDEARAATTGQSVAKSAH